MYINPENHRKDLNHCSDITRPKGVCVGVIGGLLLLRYLSLAEDVLGDCLGCYLWSLWKDCSRSPSEQPEHTLIVKQFSPNIAEGQIFNVEWQLLNIAEHWIFLLCYLFYHFKNAFVEWITRYVDVIVLSCIKRAFSCKEKESRTDLVRKD